MLKDIKKNLEASYLDIVKTNWKIWPATQLINFYFVPFKHRILVRINYFSKIVHNDNEERTKLFSAMQ